MSKRKHKKTYDDESSAKHFKGGKEITHHDLFIACIDGNLELVKAAIQQKKVDLNETGKNGRTLFYMACLYGHITIVKELITQRVDMEKADSDRRTPFYVACREGYLDIVRELIAQHVDMETPNVCEWTPFYIACNEGNIEIVKELIPQHVDIEKPDYTGRTPFYAACECGSLEIVKELINQRVDIEKPNNNKRTPFHAACSEGHLDIIRELIAHNIDFLKPDYRGQSPFDVACWRGRPKIIRELSTIVPISEIKKNLSVKKMNTIQHTKKVELILESRIKNYEYHKIMFHLLFGQQRPDSPLSTLHRDLLQDIEKIIKEKIFCNFDFYNWK